VVLVDFAACTFIDSSIVALLVAWDRRARAAGGELVSLVAPGPVSATLGLTGVLQRLNVVQERAREPTDRPRRAGSACRRSADVDPGAASGRLCANDHEGATAGKNRRGARR